MTKKRLDKFGKNGKSEYAVVGNQKHVVMGDMPPGSLQEGVISGKVSEGVISGLPHPIRHFERSDHLCRDVQRLRK